MTTRSLPRRSGSPGRRKRPAPPALDPTAFADVAAVRARWEDVDAAIRAFVDGLTETDLGRIVAYLNSRDERWAYPLWQVLIHQANHVTQHLSEVAAALTRFGHSPGWLDFLLYVDQRDAG